MWATISRTPRPPSADRQAAIIPWHSSTVTPIGFSSSTCFPAAAAARTSDRCVVWGVAMTTASTSGRASSPSTDVSTGTPKSEASAAARLPPATATRAARPTSTRFASACAWTRAIPPDPIIPTPTTCASSNLRTVPTLEPPTAAEWRDRVGVVFTDARVIDGIADEARDHVDVVVGDDGRIASIEDHRSRDWSAGPQPPRVIDAAGDTLLPGLIDCHAHYTMDARLEVADGIADALYADSATAAFIGARNARLALDGGVTTARSAGAAHSRDIALRDAITAGH